MLKELPPHRDKERLWSLLFTEKVNSGYKNETTWLQYLAQHCLEYLMFKLKLRDSELALWIASIHPDHLPVNSTRQTNLKNMLESSTQQEYVCLKCVVQSRLVLYTHLLKAVLKPGTPPLIFCFGCFTTGWTRCHLGEGVHLNW